VIGAPLGCREAFEVSDQGRQVVDSPRLGVARKTHLGRWSFSSMRAATGYKARPIVASTGRYSVEKTRLRPFRSTFRLSTWPATLVTGGLSPIRPIIPGFFPDFPHASPVRLPTGSLRGHLVRGTSLGNLWAPSPRREKRRFPVPWFRFSGSISTRNGVDPPEGE
jgi:hypothetical protein